MKAIVAAKSGSPDVLQLTEVEEHPPNTVRQRGITMNSINKTARTAGLLYLVLALLSAFGLVYVPSMILVPGDAAATATNIVASESLFRLAASL